MKFNPRFGGIFFNEISGPKSPSQQRDFRNFRTPVICHDDSQTAARLVLCKISGDLLCRRLRRIVVLEFFAPVRRYPVTVFNVKEIAWHEYLTASGPCGIPATPVARYQ